MPATTTLPIMAGLSILGAALGVSLGRSAIAEINPAYFSEPEDELPRGPRPLSKPRLGPGPGGRISGGAAAGAGRRPRQRLHRLPRLSGRICSAPRSGGRRLSGRLCGQRAAAAGADRDRRDARARPGPGADRALRQLSGEQRGKAAEAPEGRRSRRPRRNRHRDRTLGRAPRARALACRSAAPPLNPSHDLHQRHPPVVPRLFRHARAPGRCPRRRSSRRTIRP